MKTCSFRVWRNITRKKIFNINYQYMTLACLYFGGNEIFWKSPVSPFLTLYSEYKTLCFIKYKTLCFIKFIK